MDNRIGIIAMAFGIAAVMAVLMFILFNTTGGAEGEGFLNRFAVALGGNFANGGYIQFFTFIAFFWGMTEIFSNLKRIKNQQNAFLTSEQYNLLPVQENYVLSPNNVQQIKLQATQLEQQNLQKTNERSYLLQLVKKACTKFRATSSISESLEVVSTQCRINLTNEESRQSVIRYLAWAIPSIGFIGTVLGISQALLIADSGDTKLITATLGIAFDTTLVALFLSLILMWFFHRLQERGEKLHSDLEEYVIENLINRIDLN
ncbi:MAG: MotA/TolQ/ExbB proton channel family protein [Bacteroidota bacterium]